MAMEMQEGIGRGGYRLLALVFTGLGGLGIIATLVAFEEADLTQFFRWLGFALTTFAIFSMLVVVLVILSPPRASRGRTADSEPSPDPVTLDESQLPEALGATTDPGVEFQDAEPVPVPEPVVRGPPPRAQPAPPPFVHPPTRPKDTKGWPARKGATGMTRREAAEAASAPQQGLPPAPPADPEHESLRGKGREPPLIVARTTASADAAGLPDNLSVGKCGNCGALLMAPKKRPIRLQCPRCERVHTLA